MAKNNSLVYIKRYLNKFEDVEKKECLNSTYYKIGNIKIRLSDHFKKQTKVSNKYDLNIIQPANDSKQYIIMLNSSLSVLVMDLKGTKAFINDFLLMKKLNTFKIDVVNEIDTTDVNSGILPSDTIIKKLNGNVLGNYLGHKYPRYYSDFNKTIRKMIRGKIKSRFTTIKEMNEYMVDHFIPMVNELPRDRHTASEIGKLFKLT